MPLTHDCMSQEREDFASRSERFPRSFTEDQKIAIVGSLFRIAFADDEFTEDEVEFVAAICQLLDYEVNEDDLRAYTEDPLRYLNTLKELSEEQLIWYCRALYLLILMDDKLDLRELDRLKDYLDVLGIDKDTFLEYVRME